jgi:AraC family transcriptional regulator of adaptative response/methylated-DNA-[protein]-cysteine methyltransferase
MRWSRQRVRYEKGDVARWAAVAARDGAADGRFCYSVSTTGVYCRPSCPSRPARRENVAFHATPADAEAAGFRPCKRCKPNAPLREAEQARLVAAACERIETAEEPPKLAELAAAAGLSAFHFHRLFRSVAGVTPKAYAQAHRHRRVRDGLSGKNSVIRTAHEAGYGSSSRFYADAGRVLGMRPGAYRRGGLGAEIRFATGMCSLGCILVAATDKGVCAILLGDSPAALERDLEQRFLRATIIGGDKAFARLVARVIAFVERPGARFDLPLDVQGTAFQHRVWQALTAVPAGSTASYAEIARRIGSAKAVRAVAGACAANPVAIAIPCHRVVRGDGALAGYRWGLERKRKLIEREQSV